MPKSATLSGLIPRHPTSNDWRDSLANHQDSIGLQEMLSDLDQHARYILCVYVSLCVCVWRVG